MVAVAITVEGEFGLTWPHWKRLVAEVEQLGFADLFLSDHFGLPVPPDHASLELVVALTYLADHTQRVHFGPMVSPLSFRDPVMLARQAAALDDLSGGRMILGVGAGWQEREHAMFGYELGDVTTRMDRLEEGLEVVTRLLRSDEPVSYDGRFFQLRDAVLLPRPQRPGGPPIMVGGRGPKRTLPLVARYANIWNAVRLTPDDFRERSTRLDTLLQEVGRQPGDVKRTFNVPVVCGRDTNDLERRVRGLRRWGMFAGLSLDELFDALRGWPAIVGTPEEVVAQMQAYAAVGVEEIMLQWVDMEDIDGLQLLAKQVLPHV